MTQSVQIKGRDTNGGSSSAVLIERYTDTLGVAIMEQIAVSQGRYFGTGYFVAAVTASGVVNILLRTPSGAALDAVQLAGVVTTGAQALLEVFEAPTTSADGTPLGVLQVNRRSSVTPQVLVFHTPTISDDGTRIFRLFIPGGGTGNAVGGTSAPFQRLHAAASTDYLIRVTNRGSASAEVGINLNWIETPPGD